MVKLTKSLRVWFVNNGYTNELALIGFGHTELFTDEMKAKYLEWCKTDEGKKYLKGGELYEPPMI